MSINECISLKTNEKLDVYIIALGTSETNTTFTSENGLPVMSET